MKTHVFSIVDLRVVHSIRDESSTLEMKYADADLKLIKVMLFKVSLMKKLLMKMLLMYQYTVITLTRGL